MVNKWIYLQKNLNWPYEWFSSFCYVFLEGLTNFMYINSYNLETNYYLVLFVKNLKIIHARSSPYLQ